MKILVTGGAGYIGSHTCVELLEAGYDVVVVDNLYNASPKVIGRIKEITGKDVTFYEKDIRDLDAMNEIFAKEKPDTVIHFAGLKAVGRPGWRTCAVHHGQLPDAGRYRRRAR